MAYFKNKYLLSSCIIGLSLLVTTPTYAQETIISDTTNHEQTEISEVETELLGTETKRTPITYSESTLKKYNKFCKNAETLMAKENFEKANEVLINAKKLCPDLDTAYALTSICRRKMLKFDEAKDNAQVAFKLNPDNYLTNEEMGINSCLEGNYNKALFFLNRAERLNQTYERTYANRGFTYYLMGEYEKSIADFDTAIRLNSNSAFSHEYRAYAYLKADAKKNAQLAIKDVNFLIQREPKNIDWYSLRAKCYAYMNNVPMALADINKVVKTEPDNYLAYLARLDIYELINASDSLISKDIASAEKCAGNDTKTLSILADLALSKNDTSLAERLANKVLVLEPNNTSALLTKSLILILRSDYSNALTLLKKIDKNNLNENTETNYYLISVLSKAGVAKSNDKELLQEIISDANYSLGIEDLDPSIYSLKGAAYIMLGEYQLGIDSIKKAQELGEPSMDNIYWLGLAKFQLGQIKYNAIGDDNNPYVEIILSYCPRQNYTEEEMDSGVEFIEAFDVMPEKDIAAKINFLELLNIEANLITSKGIMKLISQIEKPEASLEQAYERDGRIITIPYKNINGDYGNGISKEMKNKIIEKLSHRAIIAAIQNGEDLDAPLSKFFETANPKQIVEVMSDIIDNIYYEDTNALNKIIDNVSLYTSLNNVEQNKVKQVLRKAYYKLGLATEENEGLEAAMSYYENAIYYGYPKFDIYREYAGYYYDVQDYFNAVKWATAALKIKADANLYALRGDAKSKLKDYDGAIYDFTKALGYNSKLYEAYFSRAQIYFNQKKWALAQADYMKYITYDKKEAAAPFNIATCLQNQGKKQAAIPWYEKAKALYQEYGNESDYKECVRRINKIKGYDNSWW